MRCVLAIDCSTDECSLAVWRDGAVAAHRMLPARQAGDDIIQGIDGLLTADGLQRGDLTGLAVGIGPGTFTGVRLAVATVQGLALALALPVHPVSTLAAIAWPVRTTVADGLPVLSLLDARMGEVYAGWFRPAGDDLQPLAPETVVNPADLRRPAGVSRFCVVGPGYAVYREAVDAAVGRPAQVSPPGPPIAAAMAEMAARRPASAGRPAEGVEPAYLRNKVALTSREQQALREPK